MILIGRDAEVMDIDQKFRGMKAEYESTLMLTESRSPRRELRAGVCGRAGCTSLYGCWPADYPDFPATQNASTPCHCQGHTSPLAFPWCF